MIIIMWLLGLVLLYFFIGSICVKLVQLYDSSESEITNKKDFYLCIMLWPIIFCMFSMDNAKYLWKYLWKIFSKCSCFDWFFNLGKKK